MKKTSLFIRSGSTAALQKANFVLAKGEPCFDTTEKSVKVGDGIHHWTELQAYFLPTSDVIETVTEAVAAEAEAREAAVSGAVSNIAPSYDETQTYVVGAYCIYENKLYKCNTAIEEAEEWNAEHWTETTVMAEL